MESAHNWHESVILADAKAGVFVLVHNSVEAATSLMECWPEQHGEAFFEAIRICADAFDGEAEEEDVRDAFLAAAQEAHIAVTVH